KLPSRLTMQPEVVGEKCDRGKVGAGARQLRAKSDRDRGCVGRGFVDDENMNAVLGLERRKLGARSVASGDLGSELGSKAFVEAVGISTGETDDHALATKHLLF